jgi:glycosyltransferase involved in cell wall biosynthesis
MNAAIGSKRKFVVAFNRDRDGYQVPLALHSAAMLQGLVTDFYAPDRYPGKWLTPKRLIHRHVAGLPSSVVHSSLRALLLQVYHETRQAGGDGWFMKVDAILSRNAANLAAESSADLLLYSQYAQEAFADSRLSKRLKGLFFFHPHPALGTEILLKDFERFPECVWSVNNATEMVNSHLKARIDAECSMADFFICASSFTRQSLIFHGIAPERIAVAPYGTRPANRAGSVLRNATATRFLFVGQGLQRKGLHHLLRAWKEARLGNATLRLICSRLDPGFQHLLDQPNVEYSPAVTRAEILDAFASSHIFVMPSLVEGFGLVYLEALASGCYLIATPNTGVPDLGLSEEMALLVKPGNVGQLSHALRQAHERRSAHMIDHEAIARFADSLSWGAFRQRVVSSLDDSVMQAALYLELWRTTGAGGPAKPEPAKVT